MQAFTLFGVGAEINENVGKDLGLRMVVKCLIWFADGRKIEEKLGKSIYTATKAVAEGRKLNENNKRLGKGSKVGYFLLINNMR